MRMPNQHFPIVKADAAGSGAVCCVLRISSLSQSLCPLSYRVFLLALRILLPPAVSGPYCASVGSIFIIFFV